MTTEKAVAGDRSTEARSAQETQTGAFPIPFAGLCQGSIVGLVVGEERINTALSGSRSNRKARNEKPLPSDHAPVFIDIDSPGLPFDDGWASADSRIAGRRR